MGLCFTFFHIVLQPGSYRNVYPFPVYWPCLKSHAVMSNLKGASVQVLSYLWLWKKKLLTQDLIYTSVFCFVHFECLWLMTWLSSAAFSCLYALLLPLHYKKYIRRSWIREKVHLIQYPPSHNNQPANCPQVGHRLKSPLLLPYSNAASEHGIRLKSKSCADGFSTTPVTL